MDLWCDFKCFQLVSEGRLNHAYMCADSAGMILNEKWIYRRKHICLRALVHYILFYIFFYFIYFYILHYIFLPPEFCVFLYINKTPAPAKCVPTNVKMKPTFIFFFFRFSVAEHSFLTDSTALFLSIWSATFLNDTC